jgi:hypothetical protein
MLLFCGALYSFVRDRQEIRKKSFDMVHGLENDFEKARFLAGWIFEEIHGLPSDTLLFNIPVLRYLGARPIEVLRRGGCCGGKSRLLICMLRSIGIQSAQVTLYHVKGNAQHALVEARLSTYSVLLDPSYGFYFTSKDGEPVGFESVLAGTQPNFAPLSRSDVRAYPEDDYYNFDYRKTKTANWTMGPIRKTVYKLLWIFTLGKIDRIFQPWWFEHPQLIICLGLLCAILGLIFGLYVNT